VPEPGLIGPIQSPAHRFEGLRALTQAGRWPVKWWLSLLLFLLTLVSTTLFGFALVRSFQAGNPFDVRSIWDSYVLFSHGDAAVWSGLRFSIPLLLILLTHELGHYVECLLWRVDASLPYFLPSPTLFGTLGAFIRIRSPIYTRKSLFDIGIAGPLAGFVMLIPFLVAGVMMSHVLPAASQPGPFIFGTPLALRAVEWMRFGSLQPSRILLHPMAVAAWAGLLATFMNLLPMGQLDGGHILYAVFGERSHRVVSLSVVILLVLLGFLYWPWWFWAVVTFFVFRRHPLVYDQRPISQGRSFLCIVALVVFVLSVSIVPIRIS
jgi:membrane-associated protease RseP (regulator of RpoE activity)